MKRFFLALIIIFSSITAYAFEELSFCPDENVPNAELIVVGIIKKVKTRDHFVKSIVEERTDDGKCLTTTIVELQPLKILKASKPLRSGPLTISANKYFTHRACDKVSGSSPKIDINLDEGAKIIAAVTPNKDSTKEEWFFLGAFDLSRLDIVKAYLALPPAPKK